MSQLIKNGSTLSDAWKTLHLAETDKPELVRLPIGPVLVPLAVWKARRAELIHREYEHGWPLGIWLSAQENAAEIADDIDDFTVIALEFDRYSDGKSYANARALREQHGYTGELRAIGDVPFDRPAYQHATGFNTFAVKASPKVGATLPTLKFGNQQVHTLAIA